MQAYKDLITKVLNYGEVRKNRTGVDTVGIFGAVFEHNFHGGFPLLTTKRIHFKSVIYELMWFLQGRTNVKWLQEHGVRIWNEWADSEGEVGPVYGHQWRDWGGYIDQIAELVRGLKENPDSRRHIVSAWNVSDIHCMKLPCCHVMFQCNVTNEGCLDLQMYQRSADLFLGVPFNIASYALLMIVLCNCCKLMPRRLRICFGDLHIYTNHRQQIEEQMARSSRALPFVSLARDLENPWDLQYEDVILDGYNPHPPIAGQVAV